jgi:hypothetical protein
LFFEKVRDNTNHLATIFQYRIGERSHKSNVASTINESVPADSQQLSEFPGSIDIYRIVSGARAAEYAYVHDVVEKS